MRYISTRGQAPSLGFEDVLLAGLAGDGGLYVPEVWPQFTPTDLSAIRAGSYCDAAFSVMSRFTGDAIAPDELRAMIEEAYATFDHPAVVPLKQMDTGHWLLELFHGPTLAFKDVAMQVLARLMDHALARRKARATVVVATSGDTGGAAAAAFAGRARVDLFVLHPHGRVSEVQRRQMTTLAAPNVRNIAIKGHFDDTQALLKALFNDQKFRNDVSLSGVNSINWARIMAQIVYYVTSATALAGPDGGRVSFCVPSANFGDIFAGFAAKRMGAPIDRLVIATNRNDILHRAVATGRYEVDTVAPTQSPSMDIQVSSNFERLLFIAGGNDAKATSTMMAGLQQSGAFTIPDETLRNIRREFSSGMAGEDQTARTIADTLAATGELIDPHTAVGYYTARRIDRSSQAPGTPMVTLATAHPAKFPDAVHAASGRTPGLPPAWDGLFERPEHYDVMANDVDMLKAHIIATRSE